MAQHGLSFLTTAVWNPSEGQFGILAEIWGTPITENERAWITEIREASDHLRTGLPAALVAEVMNREAVHCVYADRIDYVVTQPYVIDEDSRGGLFTYEATLTGIQVGDSLRPIAPPLPIYFVRPDRIPEAVAAGKV